MSTTRIFQVYCQPGRIIEVRMYIPSVEKRSFLASREDREGSNELVYFEHISHRQKNDSR